MRPSRSCLISRSSLSMLAAASSIFWKGMAIVCYPSVGASSQSIWSVWPRGKCCSTSSSRSLCVASPGTCDGFARCALRCRTNATTCSASRACSMENWRPSRQPIKNSEPECAKRAFCTACHPLLPPTGSGWSRVRAKALFDAVSQAMAQKSRSSSLVKLNSPPRDYFTPRRHLGDSYLSLLQFLLNHRRFMRRRRAERNGKSPCEIDDGTRLSTLARSAGPGTSTALASLIRGGWPPPEENTPRSGSRTGGNRTPVVTQNRQNLNHADDGYLASLIITNTATRRKSGLANPPGADSPPPMIRP
jgi:hypothetical protein